VNGLAWLHLDCFAAAASAARPAGPVNGISSEVAHLSQSAKLPQWTQRKRRARHGCRKDANAAAATAKPVRAIRQTGRLQDRVQLLSPGARVRF
jgi:hypothetical protein